MTQWTEGARLTTGRQGDIWSLFIDESQESVIGPWTEPDTLG